MKERVYFFYICSHNDKYGIIPGRERCRACHFSPRPHYKSFRGKGVEFGEGEGSPF